MFRKEAPEEKHLRSASILLAGAARALAAAEREASNLDLGAAARDLRALSDYVAGAMDDATSLSKRSR